MHRVVVQLFVKKRKRKKTREEKAEQPIYTKKPKVALEVVENSHRCKQKKPERS